MNDDLIRASIPALARLSRPAASIRLGIGRIWSGQAGDYQSPFRGRGMEFDESRLYQPGDDVRNIDWRVTARTGKPHTKLFREERERPVFVWVDLRAPMHFATRGKYKSVRAAELAALVAWSAVAAGDRVGGVIFSDREHHELKPQRGKRAALRLLSRLAHDPGWSSVAPDGRDAQPRKPAAPVAGHYASAAPGPDAAGQAAGRALLRLRRVTRPGSLIFLISDFRLLDEQARKQLSLLNRHNEVVMLFVYDWLEQTLPPPGRYRLGDGQRETLLNTADTGAVRRYEQQFQERLADLSQLAGTNRILLLRCRTDDEPVSILINGLRQPPGCATRRFAA